MKSRVLLIRHGIPDWNSVGRFQGHADVPLNDTGLAQAARMATQVAGYQPTRLLSSDLGRARQTAEFVAAACHLPIEVDARLREVNVGSWAGLDMETVGEQVADFWPAWRGGRDDGA